MLYIDHEDPGYEAESCLKISCMPSRFLSDKDCEIVVLKDSAPELRDALLKMAQCFTKEFHYGPAFRYDTDMSSEYKGTLFVQDRKLVGGCSFHKLPNVSDLWSLSWVWLHPEYRRIGLFRKVWDEFLEELSFVALEGPFSEGMKSFISSFLRESDGWESVVELDIEKTKWFLQKT